MKIIYIINSDFGGNQIGGRAKRVIDQLKQKDETIILCRDFAPGLNNEYNVKKIIPFGKLPMQMLTAIQVYVTKRLPINNLKIKIFEFFLKKELKKINWDDVSIVHSCDFLPEIYELIKKMNPNINIYQDVPIAFGSILEKANEVDRFWNENELLLPKYIRDSFKFIDKFIAPSNFVLDSLLLEGIPKEKVSVIPFGVDIGKFKSKNLRKKKFVVVFSGNVNNRKGVKYLVEAWKNLNLKNAELRLYGRVYPEVKQYFEDGSKYGITTYGYCSHSELIEGLQKASIFVFPSLMEGSAKAVYEALAMRLPVITTYHAGSIVENGKEGFVIPIQDVKVIEEKILFFYNNRKEIEKFGDRSRKKAEKFTWERYGEKVVEEYKKKHQI